MDEQEFATFQGMAAAVGMLATRQATLRDQFAMAALQGTLSGETTYQINGKPIGGDPALWAQLAYIFADAMLLAGRTE